MVKIIAPKQTLMIFISLFILAVIVAGIAVYFILKSDKEVVPAKTSETPEKTAEEILQSLTAPADGRKSEVPQKTIKSLSAPSDGKILPEEIIKSLTAPNN